MKHEIKKEIGSKELQSIFSAYTQNSILDFNRKNHENEFKTLCNLISPGFIKNPKVQAVKCILSADTNNNFLISVFIGRGDKDPTKKNSVFDWDAFAIVPYSNKYLQTHWNHFPMPIGPRLSEPTGDLYTSDIRQQTARLYSTVLTSTTTSTTITSSIIKSNKFVKHHDTLISSAFQMNPFQP